MTWRKSSLAYVFVRMIVTAPLDQTSLCRVGWYPKRPSPCEKTAMPRYKRERREPTDDYHQLSLWANWPEHRTFELIRPVVLFGLSPAARARETGAAERTIRRKADRFDACGMASLFTADEPVPIVRDQLDRRALAPNVRQLIVDLKLATICYLQYGRRPAPHEKKPMPFAATRRHQVWAVDVRYLEEGIHNLGGGNIYLKAMLNPVHSG